MSLRSLKGIAKAEYIHRPSQIARRLARSMRPTPAEVEVELPWGLPILIDPRKTIGRAIWLLGVYELPVCEIVHRVLRPGDLAIDVGANIGQMTSLMASRVGRTGKVIAFEPHPRIAQTLRDNVASWRSVASIEVVEKAVGNRPGRSTLSEPTDFSQNEGTARIDAAGRGHSVAVTTLDAAVPDLPVKLVKIDAEGMDLEVLAGASSVLARTSVVVLEHHPSSTAELIDRLPGFHLYLAERRLSGLRLQPIDQPTSRSHWEPPTIVALRAHLDLRLTPGWKCLEKARSKPAQLPARR